MINPPISKQRLQEFLFTEGIEIVDCACDLIQPISKDYIAGPFSQAFLQWLRERGLDRYVPGKNECTKFGLHAQEFFAECYFATEEAAEGVSGGFGAFNYTKATGGGHGINIFIDRNAEAGELICCYFEPQNQTLIRPSRKENTPARADFR